MNSDQRTTNKNEQWRDLIWMTGRSLPRKQTKIRDKRIFACPTNTAKEKSTTTHTIGLPKRSMLKYGITKETDHTIS